ncbi:CCAAT/enhancer-binding protein alpha-like protein [Leptotrombidium deliense]|uniref:CCAAT/enhancer-binding protein alpha-like protein n=1 Tax=Leptotrombidium deliense TaxID=299467 RepID=A0A443SFM3_9ACAR|nr:CCAAT/enhancer-binding protein alpha-like protein [Leptotrombidium deliense]
MELCTQLGRTKIGCSRSGSASQTETSNLNSPEISMNLQQLIQSEVEPSNGSNVGNQLSIDDSVSLFSDLLNEPRVASNRANLVAQSHQMVRHSQTQLMDNNASIAANVSHHSFNAYPLQESRVRESFQSDLSNIKQEPLEEPGDYSSSCSRSSACSPAPRSLGYSPDGHSGHYRGAHSPSLLSDKNIHALHKSKMSKKNLDKSSDEYKKRRERNNIAVRKSREKAKQRSRDTEKKVSELQKANDTLHKEIEMLQKELDVVKSMLNSAGIHPNTIENEVQKCLGEYRHRYGVLNTNA